MRTRKRERHIFKQENVDDQYVIAHKLAKEVVERSYPTEDVATLKNFQKEIWRPL